MSNHLITKKLELGTMPVFLTSIATILGAILFLRFGYAVGNVGLLGAVAIVVIGHLVTVPTALAVSEIATNQKVEGGGLYHIISRSFGLNIGASIGITLFLSQAISTAFYVIAFAEAFDPLIEFIYRNYGFVVSDKRMISLPTMGLITIIMLTKGADIGIKALYLVIVVLFISLLMFFFGNTDYVPQYSDLTNTIQKPDNFFYVFAICFPAFTGIAAGIGLSGDLKDPKKAIPLGTLAATVVGMVVYIAVAYKLFLCASPEDLNNDQLIMSKIALWGPIIPIGLACSTLSSALGSVIIAPRTLQAIAYDKIFPTEFINSWLAAGKKKDNEPINSSIITCAIGFFFVAIGSVNFVAEIITMFFMVTYGAICLISFLEHFAADPSYRPSFKSRWYFSLFGALLCIWLMFKINTAYAFLSVFIMVLIFLAVTYYNQDKKSMAVVFQGVIFQLSKKLQILLQQAETDENANWRPAVVCISDDSFKRFAAFDLLRWIAHKYGFGTYIHLIKGYLSKNTHEQSKEALNKLIRMSESSKSKVYLDTIISPSYTSAIAQVIQLPGITGKENNMLMFEFSKAHPENLSDIVENYQLIKSVDFDICILGSSEKGFGYKNEIHIWITPNDYENASLMILLGYIILGHPEWKNGEIKIFALFPESEIQKEKDMLLELITSGRLPISAKNINLLALKENKISKTIINEKSKDADLTVLGFRSEILKRKGNEIFSGYDGISNILFVNTELEKEINKL